jgi:DNA-binding PadR family transcriptional regulator
MSPWETVLMLIIGKYVRPNHPIFFRYQIMRQENKDVAVLLLHKFFNYKEYPEKVEQTMQRVLQNLRDDGYVKFYYPIKPGQYELTAAGYKKLNEIREDLK